MAADSRPLRERSSDGHRRRVDAAGGRYLGLAPDLTSAKGEPPVELDWRAFCARYFPAGGQRFGQNLHLRCSVGRGSPDATNRNRHARFGVVGGWSRPLGFRKGSQDLGPALVNPQHPGKPECRRWLGVAAARAGHVFGLSPVRVSGRSAGQADLPDEAGVIGDDGWLRPRVCAGPDMAF
jgi:hypothetical protein